MLLRTCLALFLTAGAAAAQEAEPDIATGQDLFRAYCAQCHGPAGKGDGPIAQMLAIETPDLTRIAARNGGPFPTGEVAMKIDGRSPLLAHGGKMPLFGGALESDRNIALRLPDGQPLLAPAPLAHLVAYLESLQGV